MVYSLIGIWKFSFTQPCIFIPSNFNHSSLLLIFCWGKRKTIGGDFKDVLSLPLKPRGNDIQFDDWRMYMFHLHGWLKKTTTNFKTGEENGEDGEDGFVKACKRQCWAYGPCTVPRTRCIWGSTEPVVNCRFARGKTAVNKNPTNQKNLWLFPKIRGTVPQNGWVLVEGFLSGPWFFGGGKIEFLLPCFFVNINHAPCWHSNWKNHEGPRATRC